MKNISESMMKTALFMPLDEFRGLIKDITNGEHDVYIDFGDVSIDDSVREKLAEHFDVNITSIHCDNCEFAGIWIVYQGTVNDCVSSDNTATSDFELLKRHVGHNIEIAVYGEQNVSIECLDCCEVLRSIEKE